MKKVTTGDVDEVDMPWYPLTFLRDEREPIKLVSLGRLKCFGSDWEGTQSGGGHQ